ncbi:hypothetical protein [Klebsiella pneumoniae]|uniref:hypothetical protein n=1 Tax=Klebsiella pneumoniae TaxID=573 RepID=UPI001553E3C3|nr:hypothetical protein [Klebsiella pneumoniae]
MKKIYLDYNIFLDILERETSDFSSILKNKEFTFVYSPAHIEEVARGIQSGRVDMDKSLKNLSGIGELTNNTELFPYYNDGSNVLEAPFGKKGIIVIRERPLDCFTRVYDNIASNAHAEKSQKEVLNDGHNKFKLTSSKEKETLLDSINKKNPIDILTLSKNKNRLIHGFISLQSKADASQELISNGLSLHPYDENINRLVERVAQYKIETTNGYYNFLANELLSDPSKCFYKMKGVFSFIENMIDIVMRELMRHGYKLEPLRKTESSLHDHTHAIYATACDYFISKDRRFIEKTKATYSYLGVKTIVVDANTPEWHSKIL